MEQPTPGRRRGRANSVTVAELMDRHRSGDDPADTAVQPVLTDWFEADPPEQARFTDDSYPAARIPRYRPSPEHTADDEETADPSTDGRDPQHSAGDPGVHAHRTDADDYHDDYDDDDSADANDVNNANNADDADDADDADQLGAPHAGPQHAAVETEQFDAPAGPPPSRLALACRLAGVTLGLLLLGGAVAVAWASERDTSTHPRVPAALPEITGLTALRPDAVAQRLGDQAAGFATGSGSAAGKPPDADADTHPHSPVGLVERFYTLTGYAPSSAATLVDPHLLGTHTAELVRSWQRMRQVVVDRATETGASTVRATVRVQGPGGRWLRMRQELVTSGGDTPLITTVRVLSAQYG